MRKPVLLVLFACICAVLLFVLLPLEKKSSFSEADTITPLTEADIKAAGADKQDGIQASQELEFEITRDVALGYVPKHRLVEANERLINERKLNGVNRTNAFTWTERGSFSDAVGPSNGNGRVTANQVTSGRLRAILVDLADATNQTVWIGGVDGGIWRTANISADPSPWTLMTDMAANIAISDICQSPADNDIMYFGTGEKTINVDAVRGGGVWKSTDHGVTWNLLPSTVNFWNISNVVCDPTDPNIVYVSGIGNTVGVRRSTDGGATWTTITPTGLSDRVTRMAISSTGRLHIVCGYRNGTTGAADPASGYRYTDNPATVTAATWTTPVTSFYTSSEMNADISVTGNTLYALPSTAAFQTPVVWKSTDGGVNWATVGPALPITGNTAVSSGQAWYNLAIAADPTNPDNVMVGGLNSYLSVNGGVSWAINSLWVTGINPLTEYIHADHHIIKWNNNQVLDGGDGGLFYSANDGTNWSDRNVGLRLKQFYSVAVHPTSTNYFLGGTQDNGCHQLNGPGLTTSVEVTGGDGAFMHIDQDQPQYQFGAYVFSEFRRSINGGATWTNSGFGGGGQFINPTDYDDILNKFYFSWNGGQVARWNDPQTGTSAVAINVAAFNGATVRHINVSRHTADRVFFGTGGTGGGRIVRMDNASTGAPVSTNITGTGMPASPNTVSCVAVGNSDNNLLATFSNYGLATNRVWMSTVGGGAGGWTNITGNLPDIPVRWAMFHPNDDTKAILATELGIFETALINGASTVWVQDPNFPTVRVDMLQYRPLDGLLAAATHGRGIWTAPIPFTQPYVNFAFNYNYKTEATSATTGCRNYTDYTVDMRIDMAPVGDANVTLTPTGAALQGVDFDFTTNGNFTTPSTTLQFANGSTTPVPVTIRIYNDAEVEPTETFTLNYAIGGGTNALAAPGSSSYTFTIVENDLAPNSGTNAIATGAGTSRSEQVGSNGTFYFYSGTNIISSLTGASAGLGCVTAAVFEAGDTWQSFTGGLRSQKVFDIAPATNPGATYTVGLYYTLAELGGQPSAGLRIAKTTAATMAGANETNTVHVPTNVTAYGGGFLYTATFSGFSKFFLINSAVTLPVGLLRFDGELVNDKIVLDWGTSSEQQSKQFEVEKSSDGSMFNLIGTVSAAGNSNTPRDYGFTDRFVSEVNYYRLKMVDLDNKFTYSPTILIRAAGITQDVRVVNNPFQSYIDVRLARVPQQSIRMELVNAAGATLLSRQYAPATQVRFEVGGQSIPGGAYFLRVVADGKQYVIKVMK